MNTLKLKFKLENEKEKTISIKNVKPDASNEDVVALGNYIATNKMIEHKGVKIASFSGAVLENTTATVIEA